MKIKRKSPCKLRKETALDYFWLILSFPYIFIYLLGLFIWALNKILKKIWARVSAGSQLWEDEQ